MVQYVVTPWRDNIELFSVRNAFYSSPPNADDRRNAVAQVSVWVQRGNCPHSVESTALLMSAMLNDSSGNPTYAVRAAYSAAFSRFITGLLDGYQDKRHKLSMYSIAHNIGLPATFVELRHQCTHEELPGLGRLRAAADKALAWIWEHYWKNLDDTSRASRSTGECRGTVKEYLSLRADRGVQSEEKTKEILARLNRWSVDEVVEILLEEMDTNTGGVSVLLESVRLSRSLLGGKEVTGKSSRSLDEVRTEIREAEEALKNVQSSGKSQSLEGEPAKDVEMEDSNSDEEGAGWKMWKGLWVPKPIGTV